MEDIESKIWKQIFPEYEKYDCIGLNGKVLCGYCEDRFMETLFNLWVDEELMRTFNKLKTIELRKLRLMSI